MNESPYLMLARIRLRDGVNEKALIAASDTFEEKFVKRQAGIVRRLLLRAQDGTYADLVFFRSKADADRVVEVEAKSQECLEYFSLMQTPDESRPDECVLAFEHVKAYE